MSAHKIDRWALAALWMRAVANGCGYTPGMAQPLAIAYATARRLPAKYEAHRDGHLDFAGLTFLEPEDCVVLALGSRWTSFHYATRVLHHFPGHKPEHDRLFYDALDSAELFPIEQADQTDITWRRFAAAIGRRSSVTPEDAAKLLRGLRP